MTPVLSIRSLTKRYAQRTAVDQLTLDVEPGRIVGFLGPNGAGKTTTIRMLLGLVRPSAGTASILGYDIRREWAQIAPHVGAIVEVPAFYPYLSGEQNLDVLARFSNVRLSGARMDELLTLVGLAGRGHELVRGYSLGMKQRLGIAATLLTNPQILFLDEPTNGLDPLGTLDMRQLLLRLGAEGYTILLSSHLLHEVEHVCEDLCLLQHGVVVLQGRVQDVLTAHDRYVLDVRPAATALAMLRQQPALQVTLRDDGMLVIIATPEMIPALVGQLVQAQINVYQVIHQARTLEEVFLEAVQP